MGAPGNDDILYAEESTGEKSKPTNNWKVIVADDEPSVHLVTQLALGGFQFDGKNLILLSAYNEQDVRTLILENPDTALILLDVVMDTATSGFDLVKFIRDELKNKNVRIILRTGQSGHAPEDRVIIDYDINDFKDKTELTVAKLRTAIIASLRSYRNQVMIDNSKNYLQQVINNTASILITTDGEMNIRLWNTRAENVFKKSFQQVAVQPLVAIHPWFEKIEGLLKNSVRDWAYSEHLNVPFLDAGKLTVNIALTPMENAGEKELLIRIDDVTTLRRKEEQIALMERLNVFSMVKDELDTQIREIANEIDKVIDSAHESCEEDYLKTLRYARTQLEKIMSRKPEKNVQSQLHFQHFIFDDFLNQMVDELRKNTDVEFDLKIINEGTMVLGDPILIKRSLLGILENAVQAFPPESPQKKLVQVTLDKTWNNPERQKFFNPTYETAFLRITVTDNGSGMNPLIRKNVFSPFYHTREIQEQDGLPLNKIYQVIQAHMGLIEIESEPDKGTTVQILLPEEKENPAEGEVVSNALGRKGEGTILVCDDEVILRQIASNILRRYGFHVITAEDGNTAISIVRDRSQELVLVILDLLMPGPGGLEVFQEIKTIAPYLPVLLSSGFGENNSVLQALKEGAKGFLQKPYGMEDLPLIVFKILDKTKES